MKRICRSETKGENIKEKEENIENRRNEENVRLEE